MIDFHCHLDLYQKPHEIVAECERRQLYVLSVTTTPSAWKGTQALVGPASRIRTSLGLHPQIAHQRKGELPLFDKLLPGVQYVGEIGLDGAPEFKMHMADQLLVFRHILAACSTAGGRTMTIHSRRATTPVIDELVAHPNAGIPILHWFSGTAKELRRAVDRGCWFSVGPVMLAAERGRELAAVMPRDRVLTETDGPFARIGDGPAYPWDAAAAIPMLAAVWEISADDVAVQIHSNLKSLASMQMV